MKKIVLLVITLALTALVTLSAKESELYLFGRVKDAVYKMDLTSAYVLTYDSLGNRKDSIACNKGYTWRNNQVDTISRFYISVPRTDTVAVFDVVCPGYQTETITYSLAGVGKRQEHVEMPVIYLNLAPIELKEVSVTTSKIKFYNKGDTVVYNADAFQLAHGAMLDQLISQLPGVELGDNGQIKVNGQFVESLLLNGKEFFDGNNNIMLQNIAAFTVKNIQVYEAQSKKDVQMLDLGAAKKLTMDVSLKKEYLMGWLINAQGGYGTEDRYLGRLFASWFNPTTRLSLVGNLNNLNDNRTPGKNDTWTPEKMPTGVQMYKTVGLDVSYERPDENLSNQGNVTFRHSSNRVNTTGAITNFLPGGDTYEYNFNHDRMSQTSVRFNDYMYYKMGKSRVGFNTGGSYRRVKNTSDGLGSAFSKEQEGITMEVLDALYSSGTDGRLEEVINRNRTRVDGWHETLSGSFNPFYGFEIPKTSQYISLRMGVNYTREKEHEWRDYEINYGANSEAAVRRRQYLDRNPNHTFGLTSSVSYNTNIGSGIFFLSYSYNFQDRVKDSYLYELERLADMGVYGVLPANYREAFDPQNSYTSRLFTNTHTLRPAYQVYTSISDNCNFLVALMPEISFVHRHFNYWRNNVDYKLSRSYTNFAISDIWSGRVELNFGKYEQNGRSTFRNYLRYSYRIEPGMPDMADMLDIVDDANPLNIYYGNPDLKKEIKHRHLFRWQYSPSSYSFNNYFYLSFNHTSNGLVRGYTYDTTTGVRYNRMYNISGQHGAAVTEELSWQFGKTKQFTLSSNTDLNYSRLGDMIGVDKTQPDLLKIDNLTFNQTARLSWQLGKQTLSLRGDYTHRSTTSTQEGFADINAWHLNYGMSANFTLPAGFGISTDFMCYSRHGYGSATLDTTDPVWNARISYAPLRSKHWVFMVDGFDLLHKLSNVNYAVTATGRTVTYTNTIPRYFLFSVQYRLSIMPKKR